MNRILVTGGAGYIGANVARNLIDQGFKVLVVDNLSTGHQESTFAVDFENCDLRDTAALSSIVDAFRPDGVFHFAGKSLVGQSEQDPLLYYDNNLVGGLSLLSALKPRAEEIAFIFSSTAAVYGTPLKDRIDEDHPKNPINTYGRTKLAFEGMLADFERAHGMKFCALRYFNAAGASYDGRLGERHDPETHLIPIVLMAALGRRTGLGVNGNDYPTRDGTCIRDYVHIEDLSTAHVLAFEYLKNEGASDVFNLGNGEGFSVLEVILAARKITGAEIPYDVKPRRKGDPAVLVASSEKATHVLGWTPKSPQLEKIIEDAYRFHSGR
ncbi:MAG: UDP-glucose 4-epimerase GalE [Planctomycetes bacterium]|nr:UDP-glucose 4-epimerase GalE [Planctomycetota bacterium]